MTISAHTDLREEAIQPLTLVFCPTCGGEAFLGSPEVLPRVECPDCKSGFVQYNQKEKKTMAGTKGDTLEAIAVLMERLVVAVEGLTGKSAPAAKIPAGATCPQCSVVLDKENSSITPTGKIVHIGCKVKPAGNDPAAAVKAAPVAAAKAPAKAEAMTFEKLKEIAVVFMKDNGRDALDEKVKAIGAAKLSEIPEAKRQAFADSLAALEEEPVPADDGASLLE